MSFTGLSPSMVPLSKGFYYSYIKFWAGPFSLAATNGISIDFFSSRYLDVSVPWVGFLSDDRPLGLSGCPIRKSPDLHSLAAPRGLTQLATSFIAGPCLGIRRMHLFA